MSVGDKEGGRGLVRARCRKQGTGLRAAHSSLLLLRLPLYEWDSALQRTNIGDSHNQKQIGICYKTLLRWVTNKNSTVKCQKIRQMRNLANIWLDTEHTGIM